MPKKQNNTSYVSIANQMWLNEWNITAVLLEDSGYGDKLSMDGGKTQSGVGKAYEEFARSRYMSKWFAEHQRCYFDVHPRCAIFSTPRNPC
jgi:hypothetical protein